MNIAALAKDGYFQPDRIATTFLTTTEDVARSAGLGRDAVQRKERVATRKTQTRLREMVEILNRLSPRFGSDLVAYAWYRSEPLPEAGGLTAMQLVQMGKAHLVMDLIDAVEAGVFA